MISRPPASNSFREAAERIFDPATIDAKLSALTQDQNSLFWKLYRGSRYQLTATEMKQRVELVKLFKATSEQIEHDVFQTFSSLGKDQWDLALVRRVGRDKQLLDQINNRIEALGGQIDGSLSDGLLNQFKQTWLDSAYRLDALTPVSSEIKTGLLPDREIVNLLSQKWSGATFSDRLGLITFDMAQRVKSEIIKSMIAEESWQATARRIRGEMGTQGAKSVWRAEMVARTELARAQTMANSALYAENEDVVDKVIWVASQSACVQICRPKHGQSVNVVGYPPDDSHPNCTCDIMAVPKSWRSLAEPGDGEPNATAPTKTEWAAKNNMSDVIES